MVTGMGPEQGKKMADTRSANELLEERNKTRDELEEYLVEHHPFNDDTYRVYQDLSRRAAEAEQAFMVRCAPRWKA